jgi:hypothetical protein
MDQSEIEQMMERLMAGMEARMMADMKVIQRKMDAWLGGATHACLEEEKEPTPEETAAVEKSQEAPNGAADAETRAGAEERTGDLRLAVRCRGRLKTRTKRDGRLRQDCAATVGRPTHRFVPAIRKGGLRKGPGRMCRRSYIRGRSKASRAGKRRRIVVCYVLSDYRRGIGMTTGFIGSTLTTRGYTLQFPVTHTH